MLLVDLQETLQLADYYSKLALEELVPWLLELVHHPWRLVV